MKLQDKARGFTPAVGAPWMRLLAVGFSTCVAAAGCTQPEQRIEPTPSRPRHAVVRPRPIVASPSKPKWIEADHLVLGRSVQGRPIECLSFGEGPDCVLIMASIHGNEDAGTPLLHWMARHLRYRPDLIAERRIILVPSANPDGVANQTRGNANGVDLNRNYPAANFESSARNGRSALSEPESVAIERLLIEHRPHRIVSIHQPLRWGRECIDHDGPARRLALAMAVHSDIPVKKLGSRPGSLGSYAGLTLNIPIITIELPKKAKGVDGRTLWHSYGDMLLSAIAYPQPLQGQASDFVD
jgi:protein MpaA